MKLAEIFRLKSKGRLVCAYCTAYKLDGFQSLSTNYMYLVLTLLLQVCKYYSHGGRKVHILHLKARPRYVGLAVVLL